MEQISKSKLPILIWQLKKARRFAIAILLLTSLVSYAGASAYSETVTFDLKMKQVTLKEVFKAISDQSEFKFIYNNNEVNDNQKVTFNKRGARVEEILDEILPACNLEYKVIDYQVIVFPKEEKTVSPVSSTAWQGKTISGKVVDEEGMPLPGVTIVVKGTTQGTVTNADGEYSISSLPEDATLVFSFVGMRTQEVVVGDQTNININITEFHGKFPYVKKSRISSSGKLYIQIV